MKTGNTLFAVTLLGLLVLPTSGRAQQFSVASSYPAVWKCHGWMWITNGNMFCSDPRTHELSKVGLDGTQAASFINATSNQPKAVLAMAQDAAGDVYIVDGARVYIYSNTGTFKATVNPGVGLSTGIALIDSKHFFVTGWPRPQTDPKATVFLVGPSGVEKRLADVFLKGLSAADDYVLNAASYLAIDRSKGVLYQVGQNWYEIRAFDLKGNFLRTISPPEEYSLRAPKIDHANSGSLLEPGDAISDIAVLPNGGLAITGDTLDFAETRGSRTTVGYSRFVDLYDPDGRFQRRIRGRELQINDAYLAGFDHSTGQAYFRNDSGVIAAEIR